MELGQKWSKSKIENVNAMKMFRLEKCKCKRLNGQRTHTHMLGLALKPHLDHTLYTRNKKYIGPADWFYFHFLFRLLSIFIASKMIDQCDSVPDPILAQMLSFFY